MPELAQPLIVKTAPAFRHRAIYGGGEIVFWFGLLLFVLVGVVWGGLFFYQRSLEVSKNEAANRVEEERQRVEAETSGSIGKLVDLSASLSAAQELLKQHAYTSHIFEFLHEITHPQVQFAAFTYIRASRKIDLPAKARTYQVVGEQIRALEGHPLVEKVDFGGLSKDDKGNISFELGIIFKPELLKFRRSQ